MELIVIALILIGIRLPYLGVSMLCIYIAYAKPDLLPIATLIIIYGLYKFLKYLITSIDKTHSVKN